MNFVTVLFFLGLLLTIVASVGLLRLTGKKAPQEQRLWPLAQKPAADEMAETEKDTENAEDAAPEQAAPKTPAAGKKRLSVPNLIVLAVSAVLVVLGLGDLFGIADYGQFEGAFLLMGIAAVLQYAACLLYQCRKSRTVRFFSKLLLVMTVLELTVFQYPSYHLMLGDYPEKILLPSDATVESGDYTLDENLHTLTITGKNECVITFNDLNVPIGTVRAVAKLGKDTKQSQMVLDMADATHVDYRYDIAKQALVKGRENTQYIACEFSGDVSKLRLKFTGKNDGDGVVLQSVQLNAPIPFAVSPLRMALVLVLGFSFFFRIIQVDGESMVPTLENGDKLVVWGAGYEPQRGDVVIVDSYTVYGKPLVKRIIAKGGDTISIDYDAGTVTVNGELLQEDYVAAPTYLGYDVQFPFTVPEGTLFVMGDNRNESLDSRSSYVGCIDERDILGKVLLCFMPFTDFGVVK